MRALSASHAHTTPPEDIRGCWRAVGAIPFPKQNICFTHSTHTVKPTTLKTPERTHTNMPYGYKWYWRLFPQAAPPYMDTPRGYTRYVLRNKIVWAPRKVTQRNYNKRMRRESF